MQPSGRALPFVLTVAGVLAACGGGGGGGSGEASGVSVRNAAEGFWSGRTGTEGWADFIILEDGSTWGVFADAIRITGAAHGASTLDAGRFTSTWTEYGFAAGTAPQVSYAGSATPRSRIDAEGPGGRRLLLDYDPGYDSAPSAQALAGRYALDADTVLQISEGGAFNWIAGADCVLTGQVTPRPSGRNVFDLALTYVGPRCDHGDGTRVNGVAYLDTQASPPRLVSLALREDEAVGFVSRASRFIDPGAPPAPGPAPAPTPAPAPPASPPPPPAPAPAPSQAPAPAPVSEPLRISAGHYPPPGTCRIWVIGVPPGRQSPPGDCSVLEREVPPGGVLVRG